MYYKNMIICVTGPMAAGKNFFCSLLEKKIINGKETISIDADKAVHEVLSEKNTIEKVAAAFGKIAKNEGIEITDENGNIIRKNLGAILFKNPALLEQHEKIIYPALENKIKTFIENNSNKNVIINATVLYKIPQLLSLCKVIIFVTAPFFTRLKRAKKRDNMKISLILQRFFAQKDLFSKYSKSNADIYRVNNTGNLLRLEKQLSKIVKKL